MPPQKKAAGCEDESFVIKDMQELKTSLEFTQGKMEEMNSTHTEMEAKLKFVDKSLLGYRGEMEDMLTKLDHMENQHKRKNIITEGMTDEKGENWNDLELKAYDLFSSNLGSIEIEISNRSFL